MESERNEHTRWQLTQKIYQDIWKRWRSEYLTQITARSKWQKPQRNIAIDDVVLIHDVNLPSGKWPLGRVIECHPGQDGYVRVVTIKTKNGIIKRPVVKLSILPVNNQTNVYNQPAQSSNDITSNNNNNSDKKPQVKRTTRKGSCYFITMALMLFTLIISPTQCAINISRLNNNQSIYMDKTLNMHLIRDQWKLIVYYDMQPYWQGTNLLNKYIDHMNDICTKSEIKTYCKLILSQPHHGNAELEHYNEVLLGQQFAPRRVRVTRGLINAVGNIAHSLFGVLDDQFAEQYSKDINLIRNNQNHLALLWKNQTSIIESEYNLLRRMENATDKQHKIFNQHLNNLEKSENRLNQKVMTLQSTEEFVLSSIAANSFLLNLKNTQDILLDTITNMYYGNINIHLLKPDQLLDQLNVISGQLSKDLCLPITNLHTDLPKIYKLLKVKARMTKQYFIFEIRFPLVSRDSYEIYKLIPVPQKVGNNMVTLATVANHIAINLPKDAYIHLSEIDIQQCIHFDVDTQLCSLNGPIYQMRSDKNLCLKDEGLNQCKTNLLPCRDTWTQLTRVNTYLFFCCNYCPVKVICGQQITTDRLSKAGIVSLAEGCLLKGDDTTLVSHKQQSSDLNIEADVENIEIPPINNIINLSIPINEIASGTSSREQDIKDLGNQIERMKTQTLLKDDLSNHDIHHYVVLYVVVFVVGAAGVVYAMRRVRKRRSARLQVAAGVVAGIPVPKPGPSTSVHEVAYRVSDQCIKVKPTSDQCTSEYACVNKVSSARVNRANSPILSLVHQSRNQFKDH